MGLKTWLGLRKSRSKPTNHRPHLVPAFDSERKRRPTWRDADASTGSYAVGMLGIEERKLIYHCARDRVSGWGEVVDLGAFCGASAVCLASGLRDNPHDPRSKVHSYDQFIADQPYIFDFSKNWMNTELKPGDSFEPHFRAAIAEHADRVTVHAGDLMRETWLAHPIELLFVDASKSIALNGHILREFYSALRPGSIILHQDFYYPSTFWIPVTMHALSDYFSLVEVRRDWTAAFRLERTIPDNILHDVAEYKFTVDEERLALQRIARDLGEDGKLLQLTECVLIGARLGGDAYQEMIAKVKVPPSLRDDPIWESTPWGTYFVDSHGALIIRDPGAKVENDAPAD